MAHNSDDLLKLLVRDAEVQGLPDDTVYSFGFWRTHAPSEPRGAHYVPETSTFHPRLRVTLGEIREACGAPVPAEVRKETP